MDRRVEAADGAPLAAVMEHRRPRPHHRAAVMEVLPEVQAVRRPEVSDSRLLRDPRSVPRCRTSAPT